MTPVGSCQFPQVMGLGIPYGQGKTPVGISAPQTQFGGLVPTLEHPTHPMATAPGPYLGARCGGGGYGRSRGCSTHLNHFMGRRGPAGRRVRGSGCPAGHLPVPGTHQWATRRGNVAGRWLPPPWLAAPHATAGLHLICLNYFFIASSRCCWELARHRLSIPFPPHPSGDPPARGQPWGQAICPHPPWRGQDPPQHDFPSAAGWVCSFPCVA